MSNILSLLLPHLMPLYSVPFRLIGYEFANPTNAFIGMKSPVSSGRYAPPYSRVEMSLSTDVTRAICKNK